LYKPKTPDLVKLQPYLGWSPQSIILKTLENTTQIARHVRVDDVLKKHFKARWAALNVPRRNEEVASDTVFADVKAVDDGSSCAQLFIGCQSLHADAQGMRSDAEFPRAFMDNIRKNGAMTKLITDRALAEISHKVLDILRTYAIDDWQSEPHHQHQNFAEQRYQTIKKYVNKILDSSGAPADCWLLCLQYT